MSIYSIFSGLSSLEATNLTIKGRPVVEVAGVLKKVQSGDVVRFDLVSHDLWLDVTMDCAELPHLVSFEMRVCKTLDFGSIKRTLLRVANELLHAAQSPTQYVEADFALFKLHTHSPELFRVSFRVLTSSRVQMLPVVDAATVEAELSYLERFLHVKAQHPQELQSTVYDHGGIEESLMDKADQLTEVLPIRNFETAPRSQALRGRTGLKRLVSFQENKTCHCDLM